MVARRGGGGPDAAPQRCWPRRRATRAPKQGSVPLVPLDDFLRGVSSSSDEPPDDGGGGRGGTGPGSAGDTMLDLWHRLLAERRPCREHPLPNPAREDLGRLLGGYEDVYGPGERLKKVSAQGAVCLVRVQWYDHEYTGLFRRADYGLLRLSSAMPTKLDDPGCPFMPYAPGFKEAVVVPFVALKMFRTGFGSGNLLFGGRKTGQKEVDYFAHCVCSHLTERCSAALWPVLSLFRQHSRYPAQTGLSDFASVAQDGTRVPCPRFPWALLLRPAVRGTASTDRNFLRQLADLAPPQMLYRILACPSPDVAPAGPLQHIGDIIMASSFIESALELRLRFRHQVKEEDYSVYPEWEGMLTRAHINYGWEHFSALPAADGGRVMPHSRWVMGDAEEEDADAQSFYSVR